jgi:hypothetical protein
LLGIEVFHFVCNASGRLPPAEQRDKLAPSHGHGFLAQGISASLRQAERGGKPSVSSRLALAPVATPDDRGASPLHCAPARRTAERGGLSLDGLRDAPPFATKAPPCVPGAGPPAGRRSCA